MHLNKNCATNDIHLFSTNNIRFILLFIYPCWAVPWLSLSVAGLSPWKSEFNPRPGQLGFVVDKVALGQVLLWVIRFTLVNIIPPNALYSFIPSFIHSFSHSLTSKRRLYNCSITTSWDNIKKLETASDCRLPFARTQVFQDMTSCRMVNSRDLNEPVPYIIGRSLWSTLLQITTTVFSHALHELNRHCDSGEKHVQKIHYLFIQPNQMSSFSNTDVHTLSLYVTTVWKCFRFLTCLENNY